MSSLRLTALAAAACLVAAVAPASTSSLLFTGIRPGTLLLLPDGGSCTANFVFQTTGNTFDATQDLYLGTAGHCVDFGDTIDAVFVPPSVRSSITLEIGTVVVDANPTNVVDNANDFALIKIHSTLRSWVSPSMAWWGGPTGTYPGGGGNVVVKWTGNAVVAGGVLPRVGQLSGFNSSTFSVSPTFDASGDSGSPVVTSDGLAVGSLVSVEPDVNPPDPLPSAGHMAYGPSIERMISLAGHPLATCPFATPWPRPGCPPA